MVGTRSGVKRAWLELALIREMGVRDREMSEIRQRLGINKDVLVEVR